MGVLSAAKSLGKFAKRLTEIAQSVGERGRTGIGKISDLLKGHMGDVLEAMNKNKGRSKSLSDSKNFLGKAKKLGKGAGNFARKHPKIIGAGLGVAGAYIYHETSETYEEAKLECQETCQGFNNINISKHKYDQIVNLLYCRDSDDPSKPCSSFNGGGAPNGEITLNTCPSTCTDIRGIQNDESTEQDTHINSMLYGSCNIKDGDHIYCDYPKYKKHDKTLGDFGVLPLDKYKTDCSNGSDCPDPGSPENQLDKQFRDPWHAYASMRALAAVEAAGVGAAATGVAEASTGIGKVIKDVPGSHVLPAVVGGVAAATSNALIPDDFPGHCLHKLFEHFTNEDPNSLHSGEEVLSNDEPYKYIRKCKGPANSDTINFGPDASGNVQKCNLATGEITTGSNNGEIGTCVAWKKTPPDGDGKCLPAMHSVSFTTVKEGGSEILGTSVSNVVGSVAGSETGQSASDLLGFSRECLDIDNSSDCNNHLYCYWTQDGGESDPDLDNIYFCLNDKSLINIHNGILENDDDAYLIKRTASNQDVSGELSEDYDSIREFNKYSGGAEGNKKEIDIGDICNNYCNNYLCHEPYLSLPLLPGMEHAGDYLKLVCAIIVKLIFSLFIGLIIFFLPAFFRIVAAMFKGESSPATDTASGTGSGSVPGPVSGPGLMISLIKGLFCSIILCGILVFTPGLNDTTNELIKPITEKMVEYITGNEMIDIFSNDSFLGIFSGII